MTERVSSKSAIVEIPETTTTISTNKSDNNNVKDEKPKVNSSSEDINNRDVEVADVRNEKSYQGESEDHLSVPLTKAKLILVFIGLVFGLFLAALDETLVAIALNAISVEFSSLDQIGWVGTAYFLTSTAFQPTYGKLADIFGRKVTFLLAIFLFEIGSLICGLSPNMVCLIIARAIAGIGGGGIFGLVYIIISDIVPLQDRGKYQGIVRGAYAISSTVGPLIGGAFTDLITWRWAFYINLPFGAVTVICIILFLHLPHKSGSFLEKFKRIDFLGTFVLVISTIALLLPLNWGGDKYKWNSPIIIVLFCIGGFGFIVFAFVEKYAAVEPIVLGRLFKNRMVTACLAVSFFQEMGYFGLIYFVPLFFQIVKGATATRAGLDLIPFVLAVVLTMIFTGQLISRTPKITYKMYCTIGGILITVGAGLMSTFSSTSTRGELIGYSLITGIGMGCILLTTMLASQHAVAREDLASVTSLMVFFKLIGGAFGIAILGTVFNNVLNNHLSGDASSYTSQGRFGEGGGLGNIPDPVKPLILHALISSFSYSFKVVIVIGALAFISALFMENTKPA